jgi:predicted Rossmann fold nucleotide-binding protein DprA/Smf involved in DNA uptake
MQNWNIAPNYDEACEEVFSLIGDEVADSQQEKDKLNAEKSKLEGRLVEIVDRLAELDQTQPKGNAFEAILACANKAYNFSATSPNRTKAFIVELLKSEFADRITKTRKPRKASSSSSSEVSGKEEDILQYLTSEFATMSEIVSVSGLEAPALRKALAILELNKKVAVTGQRRGKRYALAGSSE